MDDKINITFLQNSDGSMSVDENGYFVGVNDDSKCLVLLSNL